MQSDTEMENIVPDLYLLAYIPGCFRCPKCEFSLCKQTLSMSKGVIGTAETDRQSEQCPNDGEWMVHVTYRERLADYEKRVFEEIALNATLRKRVEELEAENQWVDINERLPESEDMVQTFGHTERSTKSVVNEWRQEVARFLNGKIWTNSHIYVTRWRALPSPPTTQAATDGE